MANVTDPNVGGIDPLKPDVPPNDEPTAELHRPLDALSSKSKTVKHVLTDLESKIIEARDEQSSGSALETAAELHKVARLAEQEAKQAKDLANKAFLEQSHPELPEDISPRLEPDSLPTDVKNAVIEIEMGVHAVTSSEGDTTDLADNLDNVSSVLQQKAQEIDEKKRQLLASELNTLDGFDR